jgi:protein-glutamine gamma-glutamyltransferase
VTFAQLHKSVSYLIAGLGLAALCLGSDLGILAELAIAIGFVASFFVEGAVVFRPGYARAWTIALFALLGLQIARGFIGASILPLVLEFVAALQISRLFNRRGARDHQQIAALALLHLIAATVLSTELAYAFAFLGFVVVAPWMLALSHLRFEIEAQLASRPAEERDRSMARVLSSKRVVGARFLAGTAALAIPLFAMTGMVFIAFPRVGLGIFSFGNEPAARVSGFGSNVELGDFGLIRTDPTVVLRVTPPDVPPTPPPLAAIRMRGTSFDHYDGRRWTRSRDVRSENVGRVNALYPVPDRFPFPDRDRPWSIVLDALDEPVVFLPPDTVGLEITPRIENGLEIGREIHRVPGGAEIRYVDEDGLGLRYIAWTSDEVRSDPISPADTRRYLQLPDDHEAVIALAREWAGDATDPGEQAQRLLEHLRDSGEYTYSLDMPRVGDRQPLEVFLLDAKRGHCEYFATALAVMLRALGIPSRNVVGFLGGTWNAYGSYYALSQGEAHSWVEVWIEDRWVTLDPTPPSRDDVLLEGAWLAEVRAIADAMRTRWAEHVVAYDLRAQAGLFRSIRRFFGRGPREGGRREVERDRPDAAPEWTSALWIAAALAAGALAFWLVRRRRGRGRKHDESADVVLYRALETALARLGHARPPERTPLEHLAALERARFGAIDVAREVTERYLASRFGREPLSGPELERLRGAVRALHRRRDLSAPADSRLT